MFGSLKVLTVNFQVRISSLGVFMSLTNNAYSTVGSQSSSFNPFRYNPARFGPKIAHFTTYDYKSVNPLTEQLDPMSSKLHLYSGGNSTVTTPFLGITNPVTILNSTVT